MAREYFAHMDRMGDYVGSVPPLNIAEEADKRFDFADSESNIIAYCIIKGIDVDQTGVASYELKAAV